MSDSGPGSKDSVTEVAEESFVRERPPDIERGTVLAGRYQIEDIIGRGGSGIVLRVFDRTAQNVVALKVLKSELARDAKWEKRFSRELRLGRPIQHPNVCRIFDIGEADGHRFLTMELARGGSLRDELKQGGAAERSLEEKMADAKAVVAGLAALHAAGVVHRDFKPDNLLRMEDGRLVLSDFGLATDSANAPGVTVLIGTPHYMAPEVLAGEPATSRSDVWALGVVLHEIFFRRRPERRSVSFDGSGRAPLRPRSSTERAMLDLCERCLVETPLDRPTDATVVAKMFDTAGPSGRKLWKRFQTRLLSYGFAAVVLAVGTGLVVKHRLSTPAATSPSKSNVVVLSAPTGASADWTKTAKVITEVGGKVDCFSILDPRTARIVWGIPRHAEDVDLSTGQRRPSRLIADTYRVGCPELSPSGSALLFTALTSAGGQEIRLSGSPDGRDATTITSGSEATWLGSDDEFMYTVDPSHAALFSLPTMSLSLLSDPDAAGHRLIVDKAASRDGRTIALLLYGDDATFAVTVYHGRGFGEQKVFLVPKLRRVQFGVSDDELMTFYGVSDAKSALSVINWRADTFVNRGHYSGFGVASALLSADQKILLARHVSSDAWLIQGTHRRRLTFDGRTYSAARSEGGDLLLARGTDDGQINIWWQGPEGQTKRLTNGTSDVSPDFTPDGQSWAYADYARKSIVVCSMVGGSCGVLHKDELLPTWPRFSPDGKNLAYVTAIGSTQLTVVSATDGRYRISWDASYKCPPVWSSARTVWSLEVSLGHFSWIERNVATGKKTGKRLEVPVQGALDELRCWSDDSSTAFPPSRSVSVQTEERSLVLAVP